MHRVYLYFCEALTCLCLHRWIGHHRNTYLPDVTATRKLRRTQNLRIPNVSFSIKLLCKSFIIYAADEEAVAVLKQSTFSGSIFCFEAHTWRVRLMSRQMTKCTPTAGCQYSGRLTFSYILIATDGCLFSFAYGRWLRGLSDFICPLYIEQHCFVGHMATLWATV